MSLSIGLGDVRFLREDVPFRVTDGMPALIIGLMRLIYMNSQSGIHSPTCL